MYKKILAVVVMGGLFTLAGFALALLIYPDHDEIGSNQVDVESAVNIVMDVDPTSSIWPPLTDASGGDATSGKLTLTNNFNVDIGNVYPHLTATNSNPALAGELFLAIWEIEVPDATTCRTFFNADGSVTGDVAAPSDNIEYSGRLDAASIGVVNLKSMSTPAYTYCFELLLPSSLDPVAFQGQENDTTFIIDTDKTP